MTDFMFLVTMFVGGLAIGSVLHTAQSVLATIRG